MDKNAITIRKATKADAEAIQTIYAPYVRETAVSFEYDVPSVEEMAKRIEEVQKTHPWIVAEEDGKIVGYAYAHAFYGRAAYQWAVETSIYVDRQEKRKGIGKKLMAAALEAAGGADDIIVYTCANEHAVGFYEKLGMKFASDVMVYNRVQWTDFTVE